MQTGAIAIREGNLSPKLFRVSDGAARGGIPEAVEEKTKTKMLPLTTLELSRGGQLSICELLVGYQHRAVIEHGADRCSVAGIGGVGPDP